MMKRHEICGIVGAGSRPHVQPEGVIMPEETTTSAVAINRAWCKGCGLCAAFCPKKCLTIVDDKATHDPTNCIVCGMCEKYCPDLAIEVDRSKKPARKEAA